MVEVRTRSERRTDKKQSFVFIVFIFTVALVCFASGFMVGRNTASQPDGPIVQEQMPRQPIAGAEEKGKEEESTADEKSEDELTFYESLPKGDQAPLGTGINLPPEKQEAEQPAQSTTREEPTKKQIPEKVFEAAKVEEKAPAPAPVPSKPQPGTSIQYILQVASYPQPDEAGKLLGRLTQKGYNVYVQQADLGSKGVWYRVFVGPVTGKSKATAMMAKIEQEFKVKPLLRRK